MQAATVVINRRALRHNLQRLRELAPASKLVAVVKANAYGHGLLETARTLLMLTLLAWRVLKRLYVCERAGSRSQSCCWRVFRRRRFADHFRAMSAYRRT